MSQAPNPGSVSGKGGLEAAFPPSHCSTGVCGQQGCSSPTWGAGMGGLCQHGVNTWAAWDGSKPLAVFWKDKGCASGAVGCPEEIRRLTFNPQFFTPAFSLLLLCCGVSSNHFAPSQRQPQQLQG